MSTRRKPRSTYGANQSRLHDGSTAPISRAWRAVPFPALEICSARAQRSLPSRRSTRSRPILRLPEQFYLNNAEQDRQGLRHADGGSSRERIEMVLADGTSYPLKGKFFYVNRQIQTGDRRDHRLRALPESRSRAAAQANTSRCAAITQHITKRGADPAALRHAVAGHQPGHGGQAGQYRRGAQRDARRHGRFFGLDHQRWPEGGRARGGRGHPEMHPRAGW